MKISIIVVIFLLVLSCKEGKELNKGGIKKDSNLSNKVYNKFVIDNEFFNNFIEIKYNDINSTEFIYNGLIDKFNTENLKKNQIEYGYRINKEDVKKYICIDFEENKICSKYNNSLTYMFKTRYNQNNYILVVNYTGDHCGAEFLITYNIKNNIIKDKLLFDDINFNSNYYFKFLKDTIKCYNTDMSLTKPASLVSQFTINDEGKIIYY